MLLSYPTLKKEAELGKLRKAVFPYSRTQLCFTTVLPLLVLLKPFIFLCIKRPVAIPLAQVGSLQALPCKGRGGARHHPNRARTGSRYRSFPRAKPARHTPEAAGGRAGGAAEERSSSHRHSWSGSGRPRGGCRRLPACGVPAGPHGCPGTSSCSGFPLSF